MFISSLPNLTFTYKSQYGSKLHSEKSFQMGDVQKRNSLFKKVIVFDQKMSSCTATWSTFEVSSLKTDTTSYCFCMVSFLTSSALIFWTLRAGSSFLTVLLVLGKCITAVPAAMLEWLWQNLSRTVMLSGTRHLPWMDNCIVGNSLPVLFGNKIIHLPGFALYFIFDTSFLLALQFSCS